MTRKELYTTIATSFTALAAMEEAEAVVVTPAPTPTPTPTPTPAPSNTPWDIAVTPKMTVSQTEVKPGDKEAHLKFSIDRDPWMTVRLTARVVWTAVGFDGRAMGQKYYTLTWSPGDDLDHYMTIPLSAAAKSGWSFKVQCSGAYRQSGYDREKGWEFTVRVADEPAVPNALPAQMPFHRPPLRLTLGAPTFDQDMAKIAYGAFVKPGSQAWRTTLQYGSGPANDNETGLYTSVEQYPTSNAHSREVDASGRPFVRLHTRKFRADEGRAGVMAEVDLKGEPVKSGRHFAFQASWLSGQYVDGICHKDGLWEFEAMTPDRSKAWSAHWFMGLTSDGSRRTMWPPEIDGFEHFNGTYGAWDPVRETSTTLHAGPYDSADRKIAKGTTVNLPRIGFPADIDLTKQVHKYQTLVDGNWIRTFVDGIEICTFRNILTPTGSHRQLFHPVVNVAVTAAQSDPYNVGSGDMLMYGYRYWPLDRVRVG